MLTANLQTGRATRHLGIFGGMAFRWMSGPRRFGLSDAFEDAAVDAIRQLYFPLAKTELVPGVSHALIGNERSHEHLLPFGFGPAFGVREYRPSTVGAAMRRLPRLRLIALAEARNELCRSSSAKAFS